MKRLVEYDWPGNIRELEGLIERLFVLCRSTWIAEDDIPSHVGAGAPPATRMRLPPEGLDFTSQVEDFSTNLMLQALEATDWNKNQAAKLLGLKRTTLVEKIRAKGLRRPGDPSDA